MITYVCCQLTDIQFSVERDDPLQDKESDYHSGRPDFAGHPIDRAEFVSKE